jgi:hypothetical protein
MYPTGRALNTARGDGNGRQLLPYVVIGVAGKHNPQRA